MQSILKPLDHQVLFEVDGYTAEICIEPESLQLAYHLRYQAYRLADAIPANEAAICLPPSWNPIVMWQLQTSRGGDP